MGTTASSADGVRVSFDSRGSGEPTLVFIHGLAGDRLDFDGQAAHFSRSHRVVSIDLPGNGDSGQDRKLWTMAAYGEVVMAVLAAKQANESAVLAGLEAIDVPAVAINPDFKAVDQASLASHQVDLIMMDGVGHFAMLEDPEAFTGHLAEAIARMPALARAIAGTSALGQLLE